MAAVLAGGLLLSLSPVAEAAPVPGARYDGTAGTPKVRQFISVSKDGSRLTRYRIAANGRCNDGKPYDTFVLEPREPVARIAADGTFAKPRKDFTGPIVRNGKRVRATIGISFLGTASADGNQVTVTASARLRSKRLRCDATGNVTLNRDGTPAAPSTDSVMGTGFYGGDSAGPIEVGSFFATAPGRELRSFDIRYTARCSAGATFRDHFTLLPLILTARGTTASTEVTTGRVKTGERYRMRDRLTLAFFPRDKIYQYRGSYSARLVFTRAGRVVSRCRVPFTRFKSRLVRSVG